MKGCGWNTGANRLARGRVDPNLPFFFKVTAVKPIIRRVTTWVEKEITGSWKVGLERMGVRGGTEDEAAGVRIHVDCLDCWPGLEFHNVTEPSDQHTCYQLKSKLKLLRRWKGFNVPHIPTHTGRSLEASSKCQKEMVSSKNEPGIFQKWFSSYGKLPSCHCWSL